jgi:DUF917 family protein
VQPVANSLKELVIESVRERGGSNPEVDFSLSLVRLGREGIDTAQAFRVRRIIDCVGKGRAFPELDLVSSEVGRRGLP